MCSSDLIIVAGNVCTPEMTEQLILSGTDIVKVGIGGGSACITRNVAGVGIPQLSAVIDCSAAAHGIGGFRLTVDCVAQRRRQRLKRAVLAGQKWRAFVAKWTSRTHAEHAGMWVPT